MAPMPTAARLWAVLILVTAGGCNMGQEIARERQLPIPFEDIKRQEWIEVVQVPASTFVVPEVKDEWIARAGRLAGMGTHIPEVDRKHLTDPMGMIKPRFLKAFSRTFNLEDAGDPGPPSPNSSSTRTWGRFIEYGEVRPFSRPRFVLRLETVHWGLRGDTQKESPLTLFYRAKVTLSDRERKWGIYVWWKECHVQLWDDADRVTLAEFNANDGALLKQQVARLPDECMKSLGDGKE